MDQTTLICDGQLKSHGSLVAHSQAPSLYQVPVTSQKLCLDRWIIIWRDNMVLLSYSVLWFTYRGLPKTANGTSIFYWHQALSDCGIMWPKWQSSLHNSLDLFQRHLLFWAPPQISRFSCHLVNGSEEPTQMKYMLPLKSKDVPRHCVPFSVDGIRGSNLPFTMEKIA